MNISKNLIIMTIFVILGMIIGPTIYKVYSAHNANLIKVVEKEFMYYAKTCYNEDKCSNIIYLKDLYDNNYLEERLADPITKKYYSEESYINIDTNEIVLVS